MADHRLRALGRRAHESPEACAAWLRARIRAGERSVLLCTAPYCEQSECICGNVLSAGKIHAIVDGHPACGDETDCQDCAGTGQAPFRTAVKLAAVCGHTGARKALGLGGRLLEVCLPQSRCLNTPPEINGCLSCPFSEWIRDLHRWGRVVMVRAAVAAAWVAFEVWADVDDRDYRGPNVRAAIQAAEAWAECPCGEHLWGVVTRCQQETSPEDWLWWLGQVMARAFAGEDVTREAVECIGLCARLAEERPIREAIQRALIRWVLGETT